MVDNGSSGEAGTSGVSATSGEAGTSGSSSSSGEAGTSGTSSSSVVHPHHQVQLGLQV